MTDRIEISREQRERDRRLAWIIVSISGSVTLVLAVLLGSAVLRQAYISFDASMKVGRADAERAREVAANSERAPPPPDTAKPIGSWKSWLLRSNGPQQALARGEFGVVRVTLAIDASGKATGCSVAQSSGFPSLDNGTCLALMREGRFAPARPDEAAAAPGQVRRWSPLVFWPEGGEEPSIE